MIHMPKALLDAPIGIYTEFMTGKDVMHTPHVHSCYELYICPESIAQRSVICGIEYTHKFPSAIISKPYTLHSMSCIDDGNTDFRRYVFYFNDELISRYGMRPFPNGISEGSMGVLLHLDPISAEYIERIITSSYSSGIPLAEPSSAHLLAFIIDRMYELTPPDRIFGVGESAYYVQNAMKYVVEHISDSLDATVISDKFSVSRSKIDRDFISATGNTLKAFVDACRLARAKYLLTSTDMSVTEISDAVGLFGENYFFRFFKKHTDMTPNEYKLKYL